MNEPNAFTVSVPQAVLDDLEMRLAVTVPQPDESFDDWSQGASPRYLRELVDYWRTDYNWGYAEQRINAFMHYTAVVNGAQVHYIHERGSGPRPFPLLLVHGFPDSFLRFEKLIPMLTDPVAHGGRAEDSFDVIVPSLPGFAYSSPLPGDDGVFKLGHLFHELMTKMLAYPRYGAHGGDWGGVACEQLARHRSAAIAGVHLTDVPFWHIFQPPKDASPEESKYLEAMQEYQMKEGAYALIQGTKPQTLATALNDSPIGLAAWIVEKFVRWSDSDSNPEARFTKDELLTNVMLYWTTQSIGTSFLPYSQVTNAGVARWIAEGLKSKLGSHDTPAAFAMFPKGTNAPRQWAERFFHVSRWTEMPRGGHFAAMEEPELLAADIREFFRDLRQPH